MNLEYGGHGWILFEQWKDIEWKMTTIDIMDEEASSNYKRPMIWMMSRPLMLMIDGVDLF